MAELLILLAIMAVAGYLAYNWKQFSVRFNKVKHKGSSSKGKVIVVDHTKPDTSKEDELKDKFGDLD